MVSVSVSKLLVCSAVLLLSLACLATPASAGGSEVARRSFSKDESKVLRKALDSLKGLKCAGSGSSGDHQVAPKFTPNDVIECIQQVIQHILDGKFEFPPKCCIFDIFGVIDKCRKTSTSALRKPPHHDDDDDAEADAEDDDDDDVDAKEGDDDDEDDGVAKGGAKCMGAKCGTPRPRPRPRPRPTKPPPRPTKKPTGKPTGRPTGKPKPSQSPSVSPGPGPSPPTVQPNSSTTKPMPVHRSKGGDSEESDEEESD